MRILPVPGATRTRATALLRRPTPQTNVRGPWGCSAVAVSVVVVVSWSAITGGGQGLGELEFFGLLGAVRVLVTLVDLQLAEDVSAHLALREHPTDGELDELLRVELEHAFVRVGLLAAGVAGVRLVLKHLGLAAGDLHLVRVDD